MAARKAATPLNEPAKAADQESGIYLDPALVEIREAEAKRNSVQPEERPDALLDPALKPSSK